MSLLVAADLWVAPPGAAEPAVRGVSITVHPGEWLALSGPNGGGKTTLAMALAGLWPVQRGTLTFKGAELGPNAEDGSKDVAVIFQDPTSQLLQSTVAGELAFSARNLRQSESRIETAVRRWGERLGLSGDLERDPHTLSAGRQQLVLFAAAMLPDPDLLVADEACAHLDAAGRERVLEIVREETRRGLGVVWVTQSGREREVADRTLDLGTAAVGDVAAAVPGDVPTGAAVLRVRIGSPGADGPVIRWVGGAELDVPARGVTVVTGPNGAGKTVLLEAIAGARSLAQVSCDWEVAPALAPILASEHPEQQIFHERVGTEICFAASSRGRPASDAQSIVKKWLATMGLPDASFLERRSWTLSMGEKRLVSVLGALLAPAPLVLLDEPTAGLDPGRRQALKRLVGSRSVDEPVLIATQDPDWSDGSWGRVIRLGS